MEMTTAGEATLVTGLANIGVLTAKGDVAAKDRGKGLAMRGADASMRVGVNTLPRQDNVSGEDLRMNH